MGVIALTHTPSPRLVECQLTHLSRQPIDFATALRQHAGYCRMLENCGAHVRVLDANRDCPDGVFIEDTAVILEEVAILTSLGAASRRPESTAVESVLREYRQVVRMDLPATLEGGDVLRVNRQLLVGISSRTNRAGIAALTELAGSHGYRVIPVPVRNCLHLKTACTALPDGRLLLNPDWLDTGVLAGFRHISVPEAEPWAANVAVVGQFVCAAAGNPRTAELLLCSGFALATTELSEFAKAEGGITCLSLLLADIPKLTPHSPHP